MSENRAGSRTIREIFRGFLRRNILKFIRADNAVRKADRRQSDVGGPAELICQRTRTSTPPALLTGGKFFAFPARTDEGFFYFRRNFTTLDFDAVVRIRGECLSAWTPPRQIWSEPAILQSLHIEFREDLVSSLNSNILCKNDV